MSIPPLAATGEAVPSQTSVASDRSFIATWMFSWLLGFLAGVQRDKDGQLLPDYEQH